MPFMASERMMSWTNLLPPNREKRERGGGEGGIAVTFVSLGGKRWEWGGGEGRQEQVTE